MVKRSTWILITILALVVGAYFLITKHPLKSVQVTPTITSGNYLLTQADGVLESLRISDQKNQTFQMQRDMSKTWVITAPSTGEADQGLAGAAETQVGALGIVTTLETPPDLKAIGLDIPSYTMELGFASGINHKIEVGNLTVTSSGYYVRFDGGKIYVISQSGIDALTNLLTSPPFPATETPVATQELTLNPTPEIATPTP